MKPTVYIETTIPSYLTAWPSQDALRIAHQRYTLEWWNQRERFELYISKLVLDECEKGDATAAALRIDSIRDISMLPHSTEVDALAEALRRAIPLPDKASADAFHVAFAAVYRLQYLLTWNCTHIANGILIPRIRNICNSRGWDCPLITTPEQLIFSKETDDG